MTGKAKLSRSPKPQVMAIELGYLLLGNYFLQLFGFALANSQATIPVTPSQYDTAFLNRSSFPAGFIFGSASSSYQYEGAARGGGRGPSIWDTYTHKHPERIRDGSNGDVAIDEYHRYKEDVGIMKNMGLDAYRFSISWPRLLPNGKLSGGVNKEGIKYYNSFINELLHNGLKPFVTLFHWDFPQALEDEYGGFLSPHIINHFRDYAELCYKEFGDRVKYWITFNEPWSYSVGGYAKGDFAPGRCSDWQKLNCIGGDSSTEPYMVAHNQLLAHATAVELYKKKYQASQKGLIGITLLSHWFAEPITSGDYPHSMRSLVGNRLPNFTKAESKLLNGSFDFLGLNYYTTYYAAYAPQRISVNASYLTDARTNVTSTNLSICMVLQAASDWLYVYPRGIEDLLLYTKRKYNDPLIYITENGIDEFSHPKLSLEEALNDSQRIDYYHHHLYYVQRAIKHGVHVKGYFAWSLLDNFEWNNGYTVRFGMNFVDYKNGLKRHPKLSAHWFKKFLSKVPKY
ncbi:PREDICTED: beta-glucosidase [Prunus dulcis]|uniref:PREDICTED: beta-glucosidase n=1 Tax=Prunus dulcis TaxID=3755 RepID=A0A5E4FL53_PRUDU|nr:PREDICTED: beta-glucosidase [Prunus dulcis]